MDNNIIKEKEENREIWIHRFNYTLFEEMDDWGGLIGHCQVYIVESYN